MITDLEGPLIANDGARELCDFYMRPDGAEFFDRISHYDDHSHAAKGTPSGRTLHFVYPFLKAFGATDKNVRRFARRGTKPVHGTREGLGYLHAAEIPVCMATAAYKPFALEAARLLGIPYDHIYCTDFDMGNFELTPRSSENVRALRDEIMALPDDWPAADDRFDRIFLERLPGIKRYPVRAMDSREKVNAVYDIMRRWGGTLSDAIYFGDGIVDTEAFDAIRSANGITVSFNGDLYALDHAEIACAAPNAYANAALALVFAMQGRAGVLDLVENWGEGGHETLKKYLGCQWVDRHDSQLNCSIVCYAAEHKPVLRIAGSFFRSETRNPGAFS